MRLAFLADIHGNLPALEAAIADLRAQSPDAVYLVGDQINRCPWSNEVMDLIEAMGWSGIRGNHEVVLSRIAAPHPSVAFDDRARFPDLWWTLERLGPTRLQAMNALPDDLTIDVGAGQAIRLSHGIPDNPFRGLFLATGANDVAKALGGVEEQVVITAHTHRQLRRTVGPWQILNGGSVGIPYNGDPRAQYLILSLDDHAWTPIFRRVEYPLDAVRAAFRQYGLAEAYGPWADIHLRTIETAQPWASDFNHWLNQQQPSLQCDVQHAFAVYERSHGPGRWCFMEQ